MKKPVIMILLTVLSTLIYLISPANSQSSFSEPSQPVEVGIWLVNIEKFELSTGSYNIDFYLWFKWQGNLSPKNYEFMNGRTTSIDTRVDRSDYTEFRIRGTFLKTLSFKNYPFDEHVLTIEIEDKLNPIENLVYVPDLKESGIDPSINIPGWNLKEWSVNVVKHQYPGNETYSRFIFEFVLARSTLSSVLKTVVPILIITCIAMLAFVISPANFGQRIGLGVTTLMSAVAFHLALSGQIPPIGYLTLADKIMLTVYALFLYSLATTARIMRLVDQKQMEKAEEINKKAIKLVPIIGFILFIGLLTLV
ncbi:MAG: hypothetical protein HY929_03900 [Euryarchaeota archaeon]|nr:hypothetical protein [Euryarchaeota archaeon]